MECRSAPLLKNFRLIMAWSKHLSNIRNVIVLLLMTRTLIASTMLTPVSQETTESSPSSTGLDINSREIDCEEQSHQEPQNLPDGPLNVTIGNLTIPICPDRHSCPEKSCMVNEDGNRGCSCDEFCQFFGDCCPKAASKDHPRESSDNSTLYGYDRSYFSCERIEKFPSSSYYYLISKCSDASVGDQMREKCESPSVHLGSLNYESIPLSLDDILSYRNVYCAICNGVELIKLTPWKVTIHCPDEVVEDLKNHSRTVDGIIRDMLCQFSVVPSSEGTAARICIEDSVNYVEKCPPLSDMILQVACASFSAHFFLETRYGECVSYKNPVCYACNVGQFPPRRRMCLRECSGGSGIIIWSLSPLSILFGFSSESGIKVVQENKVISETTVACQSGEVFDPYIGSCLRLSCPDGYEMIGDECAKEVSADDSVCRLLESYESNVVTAIMITSDRGLCQSLHLIHESCNFATLLITKKNQTLIECEENYLSGQYKTVLIWQLNQNCLDCDFDDIRSMITDLSLNASNNTECRISSFSISSRCALLGNGDSICTNLTDLRNDSAPRGDQHPFNTTPKIRPTNGFKVFTTSYNFISNRNDTTENISTFRCIPATDELVCPSYVFNISLFIRLGDSGMLKYLPSGDVISPGDYVLLDSDTIRVCQFLSQNGTFNETTQYFFFYYSAIQTTLSLVGTTLSLVSLFTTLVCYITFPSLRRLVSNQLIMIFCGTLLVAQCLLLFGGMASSVSERLCSVLAAISHFLWLTTFTLSSSIAYDLRRTFGFSKTIRVLTTNRKVLLFYLSLAAGLPLLIVATCLTLMFSVEGIDLHYGDEQTCWIGGGQANLIAFGVPVLVLLVFNFSCFLDTMRGILKSKRERKTLQEGTENQKDHQELLKIAVKISSLMGFTWMFGFIAAFSKQQAVWFVFIIINSLQGVYIFLAFAATRRVFDLWRGLVMGKSSGTSLHDSSQRIKDRTTTTSVRNTSI